MDYSTHRLMQRRLMQRRVKPRWLISMPVQEFARLDGAVNLSVIANATPEEFALSGVYCIMLSSRPEIAFRYGN